MARLNRLAQSVGLLLVALTASTVALDFDLCSSFNTASTARNNSDLQSNGLCQQFCIDSYAYAITQDHSCWCSNFTPDESVQVGDSVCSQDCPGYPFEQCGGPGAFGYIILNRVAPSGTRGPNDEESTSTSTSEAPPATVTVTETPAQPEPQPEPETSTTTTSSDISIETTSTSTRQTTEPPATSQIQTVTADGTVRTVTVAPTSIPPSDNAGAEMDPGSETDSGGGLGTGAIVGIVVGVIGAVLVVAGLLLWWFFRRRKQNRQEEGFQEDPSVRSGSADANSGPQMGMVASTPISAGSNTRRNSTLQVIDPRMDPFRQGLYVRNNSHESLNTIRDDHDYSRKIQGRVLRATNPDEDDN